MTTLLFHLAVWAALVWLVCAAGAAVLFAYATWLAHRYPPRVPSAETANMIVYGSPHARNDERRAA